MAKVLVWCLILVSAHLSTLAAPARKMGEHNLHGKITVAASSPSPSPSEEARKEEAAEETVMERNHHHHHHSSVHKSVVGGGVILGCLAAVFLLAVFCYIRATGRKNVEPSGSPSETPLRKKTTESGSTSGQYINNN